MNLNGAVVSDSWTLAVRRNLSRAQSIRVRSGTVISLLVAAAGAIFVAFELNTSWFEAHLFSALDRRMIFSLESGASAASLKPAEGPYDQRLGFYDLNGFTRRLEDRQFETKAQARSTATALVLAGGGLFPIYHEKSQAGLTIEGWRGQILRQDRYPARVYPDFQAIPPLVVDTLLFIEDRQLRDGSKTNRNPAVEWGRTGRAAAGLALHVVDPKFPRIGGSTLATQLEKMRHSAGGRTQSIGDKARQMLSASLRAYLHGRDTRGRSSRSSAITSIPFRWRQRLHREK